MNKKVMALAVAGVFAAPAVALAQASDVQIYGRGNMGLSNYAATGATKTTATSDSDLKSRNRVYDSGSRLGFRVNEDLGGGMRAFIQLENGVNFDNGSTTGQAGTANTSAGTFATRDSFVGLGGSWGDVRLGRQSVFWSNGLISQMGANYVDTEVGFANGASFGRVAGPSARTNNVLAYNSPTINGFNATLSYAPQAEATQPSGTATTNNTDGTLTGLTLRYTGVINAQLDLATNQQNTTSATGFIQGKLSGQKIGIGYPYAPGAQISIIIVNNTNTVGSTSFGGQYNNLITAGTSTTGNGGIGIGLAGDTIKQRAMTLNWEHMMGNIQLLAMYGKLNKATGCSESGTINPGVTGTTCDGTDATAIMLAAKYFLSKRTGVYFSINQTKNKANAFSDYTGASYTSNASQITGTGTQASVAGADPKVWAIGVMHNF